MSAKWPKVGPLNRSPQRWGSSARRNGRDHPHRGHGVASLDGFTLHAATRAGALHPAGREALLRYDATSSGRAGARGAAWRRPGAHHAEEGLRRRDDRDRHGPAVAAVPAGHQRAPTAPAHHPLRGGAGTGEPVEVASRAPSAPQAPAASDEPGRPDVSPADTAPGRSFWRAPSPWTCSPVPPARGG
jgi:hypothetical protein